MPHVSIKYHSREFTDEQKEALADAVSAVVERHFSTYEGAVSIALEPYPAADWHEAVYLPEITGRDHLLIKAPDYRTT
ncbi:tautomerase family protein [Kitasatospora sp. NPDC057015]|uniref:tautomerase family protein n=1 Tax=Kitasatospora sp. NPDC057015 TaxID=3346001 RepID=UPI003633BD04